MSHREEVLNIDYTLIEWCSLHSIGEHTLDLLIGANRQISTPKIGLYASSAEFPPKNHALSLVEFAFKLFFPSRADKIESCFARTHFRVGDDVTNPNAPCTIDHGMQAGPELLCAYRRRPEDLVALAHECAHALQLSLNPGRFMPPVQREICAFLGEQILLDFAAHSAPELSEDLQAVWDLETKTYLGEDATRLAHAAQNPQSRYTYRWNYPIARLAAIQFYAERPPAELWSFFEGNPAPWMDYLGGFSTDQKETGLENYYPTMPASDTEQPILNAYRALGAMTLMDADYFNGLSETPIDAYCEQILQNMQAGTAFICVGEDKKPVGYATWSDDENGVTLTHRAAPFGDYLQLMKSLQNRIPNSQHARSNHERSARKEQVAW